MMRALISSWSIVRLGFGDDFRRDFGDVALADLGGEVALVSGAEDGAAELEDADGVLRLEHDVVAGRQHAFEAIAEADDLPAELIGRADDAVDDGIESGAIAAAVENAYSHGDMWLEIVGKFTVERAAENFALTVLDGRAGFQPWIIDGPALADQSAGAVEPIRIVEDDDDQAPRSGAFGAIRFQADEGFAVHANGDARTGSIGCTSFHPEDAGLADEFVGISNTISRACRSGPVTLTWRSFWRTMKLKALRRIA